MFRQIRRRTEVMDAAMRAACINFIVQIDGVIEPRIVSIHEKHQILIKNCQILPFRI